MAYNFSKSDLKGTYSGTASKGDNPKLTGSPDNDLLNRNEAYEVVHFIQKFAADANWKPEAVPISGHKVERMIHKCPSNLRSHANIKKWIIDNWNNN